jgi:hypothetical protein
MGKTRFENLDLKAANSQLLFDRFLGPSERACSLARQHARDRGETEISVSDLLAGLSFDEETRAARVGLLKENAFYLRWLSGLPPLPSRFQPYEIVSDDCQWDFDPEATRALSFAVAEADRDREYWIDSDHLLRGLLRFPNRAHFAVLKTEVSLNSVRIASKRDRERYPSEVRSNLKVVRYLLGKYVALWVPPALTLVCYLYILTQGFGLQIAPLTK